MDIEEQHFMQDEIDPLLSDALNAHGDKNIFMPHKGASADDILNGGAATFMDQCRYMEVRGDAAKTPALRREYQHDLRASAVSYSEMPLDTIDDISTAIAIPASLLSELLSFNNTVRLTYQREEHVIHMPTSVFEATLQYFETASDVFDTHERQQRVEQVRRRAITTTSDAAPHSSGSSSPTLFDNNNDDENSSTRGSSASRKRKQDAMDCEEHQTLSMTACPIVVTKATFCVPIGSCVASPDAYRYHCLLGGGDMHVLKADQCGSMCIADIHRVRSRINDICRRKNMQHDMFKHDNSSMRSSNMAVGDGGVHVVMARFACNKTCVALVPAQLTDETIRDAAARQCEAQGPKNPFADDDSDDRENYKQSLQGRSLFTLKLMYQRIVCGIDYIPTLMMFELGDMHEDEFMDDPGALAWQSAHLSPDTFDTFVVDVDRNDMADIQQVCPPVKATGAGKGAGGDETNVCAEEVVEITLYADGLHVSAPRVMECVANVRLWPASCPFPPEALVLRYRSLEAHTRTGGSSLRTMENACSGYTDIPGMVPAERVVWFVPRHHLDGMVLPKQQRREENVVAMDEHGGRSVLHRQAQPMARGAIGKRFMQALGQKAPTSSCFFLLMVDSVTHNMKRLTFVETRPQCHTVFLSTDARLSSTNDEEMDAGWD